VKGWQEYLMNGQQQAPVKRASCPSRWIAVVLCLAFALAAPATASAFGFRLGGKFWAKPTGDQRQFAFGLQHDMTIVKDVFFFNTGGTFSIGDEYFVIQSGLAGLRFAIPVADGKVLPGFRANVLLVWPIRFGPDDTQGGGFGIGGEFTPGCGFKLSEEVELFLDVDIDVFRYLTSSGELLDGSGDEDEIQLHVNLLVGLRF